MSAVSFPVTRPTGRALLVGNPASRQQPLALLHQLGYACDQTDDAYTALAEMVRKPGRYHAVVVSLASFYKEELHVIPAIKRRMPDVDVWLVHAEGRHPAMVEAVRLGADGLLSEDGLHRVGMAEIDIDSGAALSRISRSKTANGNAHAFNDEEIRENDDGGRHRRKHDNLDLEQAVEEPVLSAEELRALLQELPLIPPHRDA